MDAEQLRTLKRRRAAVTGNITKLSNRVERQATDDPTNLDREQLLQYQASLTKQDETFKDIHQDITDQFADLINEREEDKVLDLHDDIVECISASLRRLISVRDIHVRSQDLDDRVSSLQTRMMEDPTKRYDTLLQSCGQEWSLISEAIKKSNIRRDHALHTAVKQLRDKVDELSISVRASTPSDSSTFSIASRPRVQKYNLPKLQLPEFDGNPLHWSTFWQRFHAAVHSNETLCDSDKLTYLRQAIKDKAASELVMTPSAAPNQYQRLISLLKERYDQRRLIHETHIMAIINHEKLRSGSHEEICHLHDHMLKHMEGLRNTDQFNLGAALTSIISTKLNNRLRESWMTFSKDKRDVPDVELLMDFLKEKTTTTQSSSYLTSSPKPPAAKHQQPQDKRPRATVYNVQTNASCKHCNGSKHPLYLCSVFKNLNTDQRLQLVSSERLCHNCLAPGHKQHDCKSINRCRRCGKAHHTSIHKDNTPLAPPVNVVVDTVPATQGPPPAAAVNLTSAQPPEDVSSPKQESTSPQLTLQMTSQVIVNSHNGKNLKARALLDSGASISLITQRLAQQLRLDKHKHPIAIAGAQGSTTGTSSHSTSFCLTSSLDQSVTIQLNAAIVPKVATDLPLSQATGVRSLPFLDNLELADPLFDVPGRIDLILGTNVLQDILLPEIKQGSSDQPIAMKTVFGWALSGRYAQSASPTTPPNLGICNLTTDHNCDELLQKFWSLEEASSPQPFGTLTPEEADALKHFEQHHVYTDKGLYRVPLPRKADCPPLGESRTQAVKRFIFNESTLKKKDKLQPFQQVVKEYLDLGHAEPVPRADLSKPATSIYYMPMHAVVKASSTTTKLRVVFDASAKTSTGVSFNDTLMVGPTIYPPLIDILLRFRLKPIAITADITKMYRAVELDEPDRDYHRFVWREDDTQPLRDFRMTRVTFGVSASPFIATRALQQVAADFGTDFPQAAKELPISFYVDDCLTGAETTQDAIQLQHQLQELLQKGGFTLRKWRSNNAPVMDAIPTHLHEQNPHQELPSATDHIKTLGVHWDTTSDSFYVSTFQRKSTTAIPTKRTLISDISRTFDVLGWFSPATVLMKILMQSLWKRKIQWDEEIPPDINDVWQEWRNQLPLLSHCPIPRYYFSPSGTVTSIQLHGFSDASEAAYAAVVYIRATYTDRSPTITLIAAKTKVAPVKQVSIPRLELCGAFLLSKLSSKISKALNIPISNMTAWTDSTIVLSWLDGSPRRYKTYVGNRISAVLELLPASVWRHVPSADNPADHGSRGLLPQELLSCKLWWNGPDWLHSNPPQFPPQPHISKDEIPPEVKPVCNIVSSEEPWLINKFSTYSRLQRVTAWSCRFISNCKLKARKQVIRTIPLSCDELQQADNFLIQQSQQRWFSQELDLLQHGKPLHKKSVLQPLNPIFDNNILKVGGRLKKSPYPFQQKHPIILHGRDRLTQLIVQGLHWETLHSGPTLLIATTSLKYYVIGVKRLAKAVYRKCIVCLKHTARITHQQMGQLPPQRVTPGTVFDKVGLDFAGPIYTKQGYTRKPHILKTYICVFVSFTTKAVHLEPVSNLTSEAFLAAFKRFTARRGKSSEVFSDNGTNFVGASNELAELYSFWSSQNNQDSIINYSSGQQITWHFNPERAPHFGGLWEAAVKSFKRHLKKVMGEQRFTFEELSTVLCQIESCLNSRPLVPMDTHDPEGIECLTPAHFLIGKSLQALPDQDTRHLKMSLLRRWNLCQRMVQDFWTRWSTEYITTLQRLTKWRCPMRNLQPNDLVLIKEDSHFPNQWPLARIIAIHPGEDGQVRVVTLITSKGVYKRPIHKLAVILPATDCQDDETSSGGGMFRLTSPVADTSLQHINFITHT